MLLRALLFAALSLPVLATAGERVDVWALRADVARVEALTQTVHPDRCWPEGGEGEEPLTRTEQLEVERQGRACEEQALRQEAAFTAARHRFNARWRPVLLKAIAQGDVVAEVIWRQCNTTPVLDREGLESTCALPGSPQRLVAAWRLREIGFVPAFDWDSEALRPHSARRAEPVVMQLELVERFASGDFSPDTYVGGGPGTSASSDAEAQQIRLRYLLDAAVAEVRRAFAVREVDGYASALRLNHARSGQIPRLTRGPAVRRESYYARLYDARRVGERISLRYTFPGNPMGDATETMGGTGDPKFMQALRDLLARADASVDEWLRRDPRWAVFLLHRVGWHEWLPERVPDDRARLDPSWRGEWMLAAAFIDLRRVRHEPTRARVTAASLLQVMPDAGPACRLRYSGGLLRRPWETLVDDGDLDSLLRRGARDGSTPSLLGHAALAPLDTGKAYRQVLVHCPQGEWPDSQRMRHLFLAGDVMVELSQDAGEDSPLSIRHWRRLSRAQGGLAGADRRAGARHGGAVGGT